VARRGTPPYECFPEGGCLPNGASLSLQAWLHATKITINPPWCGLSCRPVPGPTVPYSISAGFGQCLRPQFSDLRKGRGAAGAARRIPDPYRRPRAEIGFVSHDRPGQVSRRDPVFNPQSTIRSPQSRNWLCFARSTRGKTAPLTMSIFAQTPHSSQVWLCFARLPPIPRPPGPVPHGPAGNWLCFVRFSLRGT
jgi:hypothetical protein